MPKPATNPRYPIASALGILRGRDLEHISTQALYAAVGPSRYRQALAHLQYTNYAAPLAAPIEAWLETFKEAAR